jgi:hypothetical protein
MSNDDTTKKRPAPLRSICRLHGKNAKNSGLNPANPRHPVEYHDASIKPAHTPKPENPAWGELDTGKLLNQILDITATQK